MGGTFDAIHKGHRALLDVALSYEHTIIGLSTDSFAAQRGKTLLYKYHTRRDRLAQYITKHHPKASHEICPLDDSFGPAVLCDCVDVLVVSEETQEAGQTLNSMRTSRGLGIVSIRVVPMVCGWNGRPISTTDIRKGAIDAEGNQPSDMV